MNSWKWLIINEIPCSSLRRSYEVFMLWDPFLFFVNSIHLHRLSLYRVYSWILLHLVSSSPSSDGRILNVVADLEITVPYLRPYVLYHSILDVLFSVRHVSLLYEGCAFLSDILTSVRKTSDIQLLTCTVHDGYFHTCCRLKSHLWYFQFQ